MKLHLGVDIGGTHIRVAAVNTDGEITREKIFSTDVNSGAEEIIKQLISTIKEVSQKNMPASIGVGMAGQISAKDGTVRFAPNLHWRNVALKELLNKAFAVPVTVINDVRAATLGEWIFGAGKGCQDLVCIFVGTGIGGGVVSGGKLLTGNSNTAGEIGHMRVTLDGPKCSCGGFGCWEAIASGWAIKNQKWINEEVVEALIQGTISIVNVLNPQRIIFGGGVIEGNLDLITTIDQGVREGALAAAVEGLEIIHAKLGNNAGVIGASMAMRL